MENKNVIFAVIYGVGVALIMSGFFTTMTAIVIGIITGLVIHAVMGNRRD